MNTKIKIFSFFLCLAVLMSPVSAEEEKSFHSFVKTAHRHVLNNGMVVLVEEMPASTSVGLYALVKTGSAAEGEFLGTGISHFLEHMMFKGT